MDHTPVEGGDTGGGFPDLDWLTRDIVRRSRESLTREAKRRAYRFANEKMRQWLAPEERKKTQVERTPILGDVAWPRVITELVTAGAVLYLTKRIMAPGPATIAALEARIPPWLVPVLAASTSETSKLSAPRSFDLVQEWTDTAWNWLGGSQAEFKRKRLLRGSQGSPGAALADPDVGEDGPSFEPQDDFGEWFYWARSPEGDSVRHRGPSWINPDDPRWEQKWGAWWSPWSGPVDNTGRPGAPHTPGNLPPRWEDDPTAFE